MRKTLALLLCLLPVLEARPQLLTHVTLEAGPHWSVMRTNDPGGYFRSAMVRSSLAGISLEQEITKKITVSTGILSRSVMAGMNMKDKRRLQSGTEDYTSLLIPLRIQYRIQPTEFPVSFSPRIGYLFSINRAAESSLDRSSILSAPDGTAFSYEQVQGSELPTGHMLEFGLSTGLKFSGQWQASFNLGYITGALNKYQSAFDLDYADQQGQAYATDYQRRGCGLYTTLSLHMPLSLVWQNKDYRIRKRIEGSLFDGKSVDRKGQLYAGGELGSLWRIFSSNHPAVGARPMDERGVFRYANLHTGIYGGYMFTGELGADLGIYYQGSSTFYALMYDHEVDYAGKTGAPMYLEIPLRIRYFYPVMKDKIYAVVYAGASMLTHFSTTSQPGTAGPAGEFNYFDPYTQSEQIGTSTALTSRPGRIRPLIRLGAGVEYRVPIHFPLFATAYLNYLHGFFPTERTEVSTSLNEAPPSAYIDYDGSGWSIDIGVKIPMAFDDREDCVRLTRQKKFR